MWKWFLKFIGRCPRCHGWNVGMFGFCFDCDVPKWNDHSHG